MARSEATTSPGASRSTSRDTSARYEAAFFLGSRLLRRGELALFAGGRRRRGALNLVNAAGSALDLLSAARIRTRSPAGYRWRLPLDVADQAFWESVLGPDADAPSWGQVGLAMESTARDGPSGLAAPALVFAATGAVRRLRGGSWRPDLVVWPVTGAVEGLLWNKGREKHAAHLIHSHAQRRSALEESALLAGQHSVAMGADSVVDAIEGLAPLLGPPPRGSALHRLLDAWKASLAVRTASTGTYLGVALRKWENRRNLHPDLSSHVETHLAEGEGTLVLTGPQVAALGAVLDAAGPAGRVDVQACAPSGHLPGCALPIEVNGTPAWIPADPAHRPPRYDPTPVVLASAIPGCLGVTRPSGGGVPLVVALPGTAVYAAAAAWASTSGARLAPARRGSIAVVLSLAAAALHGPASSRLQRHPRLADGRQNTPYTYSIEAPVFLLGYYWQELSATFRTTALLTALALNALGIALLAAPRQSRAVLVESSYVAWSFLNGSRLRQALASDAAALEREHSRAESYAVAAAYQDGRELVLGLVREAHSDAREQLDSAAPALDATAVAFARLRLAEIEKRLGALETVDPHDSGGDRSSGTDGTTPFAPPTASARARSGAPKVDPRRRATDREARD